MSFIAKQSDTARRVGLSVLRSGPVTGLSRRLTKDRLRILAYHGVSDAATFAKHMKYVADNFTPVTETQVVDRVHGGTPLPEGAVWVTFDDGDPTVVHDGLPALIRNGIPATMYVCPGLIESSDPFWWRVTQWASENRPDHVAKYCRPAELTEFVKTVGDDRRREIVQELSELIEGEVPADWMSLTRADIETWVQAGMTIGNHSWDHPCLDRCSEDVQRAQIKRAHDWLAETLGHRPKTFAYPNGNFSPIVDAELESLNYPVAVLYDNSLTSLNAPARQLSRLMVESDQSPERLIGVMSGVQPALRALGSRRWPKRG